MADFLIVNQFEILIINVFRMHISFIILQVSMIKFHGILWNSNRIWWNPQELMEEGKDLDWFFTFLLTF